MFFSGVSPRIPQEISSRVYPDMTAVDPEVTAAEGVISFIFFFKNC